MKYILSFILFVTATLAFAQTVPQKLNYQAVARNSSGTTLVNQTIAVKAEIVDSNQTTVLYAERQLATTNKFGLFTLQVGGGTTLSGNFSTINWAAGKKYIRTSIDLAGGTAYVLMGMSQLLSVPYALYAGSADNKYLKVDLIKSNLSVGDSILNSNTSGTSNIGVGHASLFSNTTGAYNTALGNSSLWSNSTGAYNTAIGNFSLLTNTTGDNNTALGGWALNSNTTGAYNTAIGNFSLQFNKAKDGNTAIGSSALNYLGCCGSKGGSNNVAIGSSAGFFLRSGDDNVFIGSDAGASSFDTLLNGKLIIGLHGSAPLISGDFYNKKLRFNADIDSLSILNRIQFKDENANSHIARYDTGHYDPIMYARYFYGHYGDLVIQGVSKYYTGNIHFVTGSDVAGASQPTQRMVIMDNGKVGIGDCVASPPKSKLEVRNGDVYISDTTKGIILTSPNGNCWRVTVDNTGNLVRTSIPCPTY